MTCRELVLQLGSCLLTSWLALPDSLVMKMKILTMKRLKLCCILNAKIL